MNSTYPTKDPHEPDAAPCEQISHGLPVQHNLAGPAERRLDGEFRRRAHRALGLVNLPSHPDSCFTARSRNVVGDGGSGCLADWLLAPRYGASTPASVVLLFPKSEGSVEEEAVLSFKLALFETLSLRRIAVWVWRPRRSHFFKVSTGKMMLFRV